MPRHLHLDFETFSEVDLKAVGAYRYAFDPSTEILCAAMALDDEEPIGWYRHQTDFDLTAEAKCWDALEDPEVLIYAHNAMFEMAICQALLWKTWGIPCPDLSRFRCTMSLARRACLPSKLEKLAEVLGDIPQKDKRGASLIRKFCVMQPPKKPTKKHPQGLPERRIMPQDEPEAFAQLVEYCRQDVRSEQGVARRLAFFDEPINNANYSLDAVINARGVPVNLTALRHAQRLIAEETEIVGQQFRELTGFDFTQNAKLLEWVNGCGHTFENLQAETVDTFLEQHDADPLAEDDDVVKALRMKQSVAYASIKKVKTMLECAGPFDNRIRGMLNHHGATTGRWTASLVQFQNMKRPTIKHSEAAYRDICAGVSREELEIMYGPVLEVISSCIRHFVHDVCTKCGGTGNGELEVEGRLCCNSCGGCCEMDFHDADYAAIEARIVNWLAGQEDALQEYRDGVDRYKAMAAHIYQISVEEVNKFPQRFIGKQVILGCGFGMGKPKFRGTCEKLGYRDMPAGLEDIAVDAFRSKHRKVKQFWTDLENAAKKAIVNKGNTYAAGEHIRFKCADVAGMPFLLMRLPSGRKLAYPRPKVMPHPRFEGGTVIKFFGNIKGAIWGDVETWGGTLAENATQAVAADIMANGAHNAERNGYQIATLIHDQALAYFEEGQTSNRFVQLLTDLPDWAEGLPIEAEGGLVPFYKKD